MKIPVFNTNFVTFQVGKTDVESLLDTGANISAVSENLLTKVLPSWLDILQPLPQKYSLKNVQGGSIFPTGKLTLKVGVGDHLFNITCVVLKDLPTPLLIGMPFLMYYRARIICEPDGRMNNDSISTIMEAEKLGPPYRNVYIRDEVHLQPDSMTIVPCDLDGDTYIAFQDYLEDRHWKIHDDYTSSDGVSVHLSVVSEFSDKHNVWGQEAVIILKSDNKCVMHIMNPTSQEITVMPGEVVAKATVFQPFDVVEAYKLTDSAFENEDMWDKLLETEEESSDNAAINILDYCVPKGERLVPYECVTKEGNQVEVKTQTEPDLASQTSRAVLKHIDWNEHIPPGSLAEDTRGKLIELLDFHRPAFSKDISEIGVVPDFYHRIELKHDAKVVRQRPYRTSPENEAEIERQLQILRRIGVVEYSDSIWNSGVLMIDKKSDTPGGKTQRRLCLDLRRVNQQIVLDSWPLFTIESIIKKIGRGGGRLMSTLDLKSAYFHLKVAPCSQHILTFVTSNSAYKFLRTPFGLANSPASFAGVISRALNPLNSRHVVHYVDDILISTDHEVQHFEVIDQVLWRLREAGLTLSPEKCKFFQKSVKYLGQIFDEYGCRPDPERLSAIANLEPPKDVSALRRYLGILSWQKRYIPLYAKICMPLFELLQKDKKYVWSPECQKAYETLQRKIQDNVMLAYPRADQPFHIYVDASGRSVGSASYQKDKEGVLRPVALLSAMLNPTQQKYSSNEKEVLAVISAIKYNKEMITVNTPIIVYSDNLTSVFFKSLGEKTGRLFRYSLFLSKYNITTKHIAGKNLLFADALSRPPPTQKCPVLEAEELDDASGGKPFPEPDGKRPGSLQMLYDLNKDEDIKALAASLPDKYQGKLLSPKIAVAQTRREAQKLLSDLVDETMESDIGAGALGSQTSSAAMPGSGVSVQQPATTTAGPSSGGEEALADVERVCSDEMTVEEEQASPVPHKLILRGGTPLGPSANQRQAHEKQAKQADQSIDEPQPGVSPYTRMREIGREITGEEDLSDEDDEQVNYVPLDCEEDFLQLNFDELDGQESQSNDENESVAQDNRQQSVSTNECEPVRESGLMKNWVTGRVDDDKHIIYRTSKDVGTQLPQLLEAFAHETDQTLSEIDEKYLAELIGAREAYLKRKDEVIQAQRTDPDFRDMYEYKKYHKIPEGRKQAHMVLTQKENYYLDESGILYRWYTVSKGTQATTHQQLCLPEDYRAHFLYLFHDSRWAGHRSAERTWTFCEKVCYWPEMRKSIIDYCKSCPICAQGKRAHGLARAPMSLRQVPTMFSVLHIDVLKMSKLDNGNQYLLVMVDRLTKQVEMVAMKGQSSLEVAQGLVRGWLLRYGNPHTLVCDRNMSFMSELFREVAKYMCISLSFISAYRPQSNSMCETMNRLIIERMRMLAQQFPDASWEELIPSIRFGMSVAIQTHGYSAFQLMFGTLPRLGPQMLIIDPAQIPSTPDEIVSQLWPEMYMLRHSAMENQKHVAQRMKEAYDRQVILHSTDGFERPSQSEKESDETISTSAMFVTKKKKNSPKGEGTALFLGLIAVHGLLQYYAPFSKAAKQTKKKTTIEINYSICCLLSKDQAPTLLNRQLRFVPISCAHTSYEACRLDYK